MAIALSSELSIECNKLVLVVCTIVPHPVPSPPVSFLSASFIEDESFMKVLVLSLR
jgi:hypothetical protein